MTSSSPLLLGIDLGTSAIKAVLVDQKGVVGQTGQEYPSQHPREGWVEQSPQTWFDTVCEVIRHLLKKVPQGRAQVQAIGFSGQMHGTVMLDAAGKPLRQAIIWADGRSLPQVERLYYRFGKEEILKLTGNPLFPGFMLPSLLWLRESEEANWKQCRHVLLPKDYLRYIFCGEIYSEPSDASATSLFDLVSRSWSAELADLLDLDLQIFPQLLESTDIAGHLRTEIASQLGLPDGIPVVCGGSDQACQAVGNGVLDPGEVSCTIGTGGQIFAPIDQPEFDRHQGLHLFCHALPDLWHLEAATLSAGLSLRWLRDLFGSLTFQEMADLAGEAPAGCEGLFFAPYLLGERTPYMDAAVRGGFTGLSIQHQRAHLIRAVMEGVVLSLRSGLDLIVEKGHQADVITAAGGAAQHPLWLKLQANIFNRPVQRSRSPEPAAVGAALLAGVGTQIFPDIRTAVKEWVQYEAPVLPEKEQVDVYGEIYQKHLFLYPALKLFSPSLQDK